MYTRTKQIALTLIGALAAIPVVLIGALVAPIVAMVHE